jgi:hypothetical protein
MRAVKSDLSREFKRLFRSMSFVSRHTSLDTPGPQAQREGMMAFLEKRRPRFNRGSE